MQGLMTGIGFIGGGAILKEGASVRGTATAASVWNTGAIGACAAYGRYEITIILSSHTPISIDMREYEITSEGLVIGERLTGYRGLTTGIPGPWNDVRGEYKSSGRTLK